jgi:uncharacterized membrane protein YphA (DoxX/SURF4 family)
MYRMTSKIFFYLKQFCISIWTYRVLRFIIGFIFIYAGSVKLLDPKAFANTISDYGLVPESLLVPLAIGLPLIEVIAGIGILLDIKGSLTIIFSLLIVFAFVIWYGVLKDLSIDCGCFTPDEIADQNSLKRAFYRDLMMIGAVFLMFAHRFFRSEKKTSHLSWLVSIL